MNRNASLMAELVACRQLVEDYTQRIDEACSEYYQTGRFEFPNLSRAEDEDIFQHCELTLMHLAPFMPDAKSRWENIRYPIDQYKEQIERMRDCWIRRRNLLRVLESTLRTTLELDAKEYAPTTKQGSSKMSQMTILFLGANPSDTTKLALQKEAQEIDNRLRATDLRDSFRVEQQWEVRAGELPGKIMRFRPQILHFSGHGDNRGELIFQDRDGVAVPAKKESITQLFSLLGQEIKCVLLNACYSAAQAETISQHVDVVIGMSQAIGDDDAISFAGAFYEALGYGKDVYTAFELAKLGIDLDQLPNGAVPELRVKPGVDPKQLVLTGY
jgi:hypothetical protein